MPEELRNPFSIPSLWLLQPVLPQAERPSPHTDERGGFFDRQV
jgi:hypothetical protein